MRHPALARIKHHEPLKTNWKKVFGLSLLFVVLVALALVVTVMTSLVDRALGLDKSRRGLFNPF